MVAELRLVPATGGAFEVTVDDELVFSKRSLRRHAEPGEVVAALRDRIGPEVLDPDA